MAGRPQLVSAVLIAVASLAACSSGGSAADAPKSIPEAQAKSAVAAHVTDLYQAAGLSSPADPVTANLAPCGGQTSQHNQEYSVGTSVRFAMTSADDAKQAITKVHDYMGSHGFTNVNTVMNDTTYMVAGSIDGQTWGVDYSLAGTKELRFQGGTGCNVAPPTSTVRPSST